jgi:hypothetical protein
MGLTWRAGLLIGFAAMMPFFDVGTLYEGAAAKARGGADISFFIGLPVAGLLCSAFTRSVDVAVETRVAEEEAASWNGRQHTTSETERQRRSPKGGSRGCDVG